MTTNKKNTLIGQAAKLFSLGFEVEKRRNKLRTLVDKKMPYESSQMRIALAEFIAVDEEWKRLEQEHLSYRIRVTGT